MNDKIFNDINTALSNHGYLPLNDSNDYTFLGEGAWHTAYLIQNQIEEELVIRFPKKTAYGKPVAYNYPEMVAEYGAAQLYYAQANSVCPGICPLHYFYFVSEALTYTLETYMGSSHNLRTLSALDITNYGKLLGSFFAEMDQKEPPVIGNGFFQFKKGEIKGQLDDDLESIIHNEKLDYQEIFNQLSQTSLSNDFLSVKNNIDFCLKYRYIPNRSLTNLDTSPENIIFSNGKLHLIDPRPILYSGLSAAGNHLNNYRTLFPTYANTPRYAKHQFNQYPDKLEAFADGFEFGYLSTSQVPAIQLHIEEYLHILSLCFDNFKALNNSPDSETKIRMGSQKDIIKRLPVLMHKLETFKF